MMPIVFPYLQELALDYLDVIDMFALLNILECVSLDSLAIRQLRAWKYFPVHPTNNESTPQSTFAEEVIRKFPRLSRLAYAPGQYCKVEGFAFHENLLGLLRGHRFFDAERSMWSLPLPRLRELELKEDEAAAEWLVPLVSARMASPDVANVRTIYLHDLWDDASERWAFRDDVSLHLHSLRLLVPEVLCGKMPPLF